MNYLASPLLVVAYALAGTLDIDLTTEPLGTADDGTPVFLEDLWPTPEAVRSVVDKVLDREEFQASYSTLFDGDERWQALDAGSGTRFEWAPESTYVRRPTFLDGVDRAVPKVEDLIDGRALVVLGDSVTTDHISPAGVIPPDGPAGAYLLDHDITRWNFNSFGARRGNHDVMVRGTFANVRLRNALVPGVEGGFTKHLPSGEQLSIFDAAQRYDREGVPRIVLAGKDYGSGSSRDWAAKGTILLGVRAVIAESYERIHRSNLIGMGVLPLQFDDGTSVASLGLTGEELFTIEGLDDAVTGNDDALRVLADGLLLPVSHRLDTESERDHYRHGGILPFVLRDLAR